MKFRTVLVMSLVAASAYSGVSIVGSAETDGYSAGSGAVTGVFSSVSAQVGDIIVMVSATTKKGDVSRLQSRQDLRRV